MTTSLHMLSSLVFSSYPTIQHCIVSDADSTLK